ncbi:MAG: hypothetical protein R6W71_09550 [Bacteroidales bacterium]
MTSCREIAGEADLHVYDASMVIIRELWKALKLQPLQLRVVK